MIYQFENRSSPGPELTCVRSENKTPENCFINEFLGGMFQCHTAKEVRKMQELRNRIVCRQVSTSDFLISIANTSTARVATQFLTETKLNSKVKQTFQALSLNFVVLVGIQCSFRNS